MASIVISVYQNKNDKSKAYGKFYGRVKHTTMVDTQLLCENAAADSGIEEADVAIIFDALLKQIKEQLCSGHPIKVENLGTMKLGISSTGVSTEDIRKRKPDFDPTKEDIRKYLTSKMVKGAHFLFTPSDEIKTLLRSVKFQTDKSEWEDYMNSQDENDDDNG